MPQYPQSGADELRDMFAGQQGAGEVLDYDEDVSDVEDTDDGGAIIRMGEPDDAEPNPEFYANLLIDGPDIPQTFLDKLASDLIESVDLDIQSREGRDKQYEEGIRRTGIANDAPGGASFHGANKTVHPMITKAAVDFEARAIKEICPPAGPVKSYIPGTPTKERLEKAERKTRHMNWQLVFQIPEFRPSLEKLLTQLPMGGVQYQRWVYSPRKRRACPGFVPLDKMIIPYAADDFYSAERRTFIEDITELEFAARVADEIYVDDKVLKVSSASIPEATLAQKASEKVEGKEGDLAENRDGQRRMYETECDLDLSEWDDAADGDARPYIVRIDKDSRRVLGLVRNWEENDDTFQNMIWTVEWPFIPWRGSMPIGIAQMIGGLSASATGALRALLDSAHINNIPTLIKLKGAGEGGQSITLDPTQVQELDGAIGIDDIRKLIMAIPFNEPSPVLYQLLGFLVQEAESVVRTTFEDLAEQKQEMPVGTTLALIEQGMAVLSAIHGRLYASMQKTICVLHRINKMYITDDEIRDQTGELLARRDDYTGPEDVIPVADPRIFSEVQRFAQMQVVADRADKRPALYNQRKVELMILERLKFPNPEQLLVDAPDPKEMNAVNENVAATLGRPITAFPEQDHLAHIQAHLDYMFSPFFGMLEPVAQKFFPAMMQHLIEHTVLWYASRVYEQASSAAGQEFADFMKYKDPETRKEIDRNMAIASNLVVTEAKEVLPMMPQAISKAMEVIKHFAQEQQPQDPTVPGKIAVEKVRAESQQALQDKRGQLTMAVKQADAQQKQGDKQQDIASRMQELRMKVVDGQRQSQDKEKDRQAKQAIANQGQMAETQRNREDNLTKERTNTQDNETALTIANAEIQSAEKVAVSTGTGLNPGQSD